MKIYIDPGHGGHDSGAVGPAGTLEKTLVLQVGLKLRRLLSPHHQVFMTRDTDVFHSLSHRALLANRDSADLFLSIHANAGGGIGFEAFTSVGQTQSDVWATKLLESFHARFPDRVYRKDLQDGDPDKEASFTVLTRTKMPAVLFELGFIDHHTEEQWLRDNVLQMADALAQPFLPTTTSTVQTPVQTPAQTPPLHEILELISKLESKIRSLQ